MYVAKQQIIYLDIVVARAGMRINKVNSGKYISVFLIYYYTFYTINYTFLWPYSQVTFC